MNDALIVCRCMEKYNLFVKHSQKEMRAMRDGPEKKSKKSTHTNNALKCVERNPTRCIIEIRFRRRIPHGFHKIQ